MSAISRRSPRVSVEYTCRGQRKEKHFEDAHTAKRFYVAKFKAGMNPKVKKPSA